MHKKERIISFMHSSEALPQANFEYTKRQCAQRGASSLTCRSKFEIVVVFRKNDLLALMLNHHYTVLVWARRMSPSLKATEDKLHHASACFAAHASRSVDTRLNLDL